MSTEDVVLDDFWWLPVEEKGLPWEVGLIVLPHYSDWVGEDKAEWVKLPDVSQWVKSHSTHAFRTLRLRCDKRSLNGLLTFDIDRIEKDACPPSANTLRPTLRLARVALHVLQEILPDHAIRVSFSGAGFHIETLKSAWPTQLPGHRRFSRDPKRWLKDRVGETNVFDGAALTAVDHHRGMFPHLFLRLTNTVNRDSSLYKIPLSLHELANLSIEEVMALAKDPR